MPEVQYKVDLPAFTGRNVPIKEIAQAMGLTHGAVRTRLSRGRAALKKTLLQEDAVWT